MSEEIIVEILFLHYFNENKYNLRNVFGGDSHAFIVNAEPLLLSDVEDCINNMLKWIQKN